MAINYVSLAAKTKKLIEDNGANATISKRTRGTPLDSNKPWRGNDATGDISLTVKGIEYPYKAEDVDGTKIRLGDMRIYLAHDSLVAAAAAATPAPVTDLDFTTYDRIVFAGKTFQIVKASPLQPGGVTLLWDVQARE